MNTKLEDIAWFKYDTENEANELVDKVNLCKGWPSGVTKTWAIPFCLQDDYSPNETTKNWFVICRDEIRNCFTEEEWEQKITSLPDGWVKCGTPEPPSPSGTTEN
jgi:hypothetical protein